MFLAWVDRVARYLEGRPYEFARVASFTLFVAAGRVTLEVLLGGFAVDEPAMLLAVNAVFYLMTFYAFAVVLKLVLPQVPWRTSSNAILIGLFLGLFPPLIDAAVLGLGNREYYAFMADFPAYPVLFWDPAQHLNVGESTAIWLSILFCGAYVFVRSRSFARTVLALALAYLVVLWGGSFGATLVKHGLLPWLNGSLSVSISEAELLALVQLAQILTTYLVLRPSLAGGLLRRLPHMLPFVAVVFLGAAFGGRIGPAAWWYAALVLYMAAVTSAQNDLFDPLEPGARRYVDREDLLLLNALALMGVGILLGRDSAVSFLLLLQFVAAVVYNYPFYRGRDYFPANLKIEGLWGASSFLIGWLAARETQLAPVPVTPAPGAPALSALDLPTAAAALLVLGGFSLVSALKDQKDVEADARSNTQTLYTLAARTGKTATMHRWLLGASSAACVAAPALLALSGRLAGTWVLAGVVAAAGLWMTDSRPSRPGFYRALTLVSALLALLAWALVRS